MKSKEKEFSFLHRGGVKKQNRLILLINCLFLSTCYYLVLAQTPKPTPDFSTQAAGHLGFAKELLEEGSKDSMLASIEEFQLAKKLFQKSGDKKFESICLDYLGQIYDVLSDYPKSLEYYRQSLSLKKEIGDKRGESYAIYHIGNVFDRLGDKQKAVDHFIQALSRFQEIDDKYGEAGVCKDLASVFWELGENQKALNYLLQALPFYKSEKYQYFGDDLANFFNSIGVVYKDLGEKQKAVEYLNEALNLYGKTGNKSEEARVLNNIGGIYSDSGNYEKALDFFNQSIKISSNFEGPALRGQSSYKIAQVNLLSGKNNNALEGFEKLLMEDAARAKTPSPEILSDLMIVWRKLGNDRLAIFYGKESVNKYQELRQNIQTFDKETQRAYLKSIEITYRKLADLLIEGGRLAEAQQVINLYKDQQVFDFKQNLNGQIKQVSRTPREESLGLAYQIANDQVYQVGAEFEKLKQSVGKNRRALARSPGEWLKRQASPEEQNRLKHFETKLKTVSDEFLALLRQTQTEFSQPVDEKDKAGEVPDLTQMQFTLRRLSQQTGQKTVAVYTLVGDDNFRALIISPDGIKTVSSPIKGAELNDKARKLWGLLQSDNYDTTVLSKQIYDAVFKPIEAELPEGTTTIMWSLDGNLRYIPMAALWDGKQFLAERFEHVIFTRAEQERMTRSVNQNWTGMGFGTTQSQTVELLGSMISFSALPGVSEELKEIFKQSNSPKGILPGEVMSDKEFTKANFIESLKQKRPVVHIASHFSFRPGDEARSFLLMGDGTAFTLNEMKKETNLFEGVDLLTLSACNTAAAQADATGKEIDGFAELAQRLGAGAVMATLWSVSDASTPWLMRDFYANRQATAGTTKTEALRKAQLALLNGTAETRPLPDAEKGGSNKVQIVIIPKGGNRDGNQARSDIVYLDEAEAPLFKTDARKPFSHPYYWSPFILIGNWK